MNPVRRSRAASGFAAVVALVAAAGAASAQDAQGPEWFSRRLDVPPHRVAAAPDGGLVVAGWVAQVESRWSDEPDSGAYVATRLGEDGRPLWTVSIPVVTFGEPPRVAGLAVADDGTVWLGAHGVADPVPELLQGAASQMDGVLARISPEGTLVFVTHVGGNHRDWIEDLAVLSGGDVALVGTTMSPDFLELPPSFADQEWRFDAFVVRFRGDGSGVVWGRRYGGMQGGFQGIDIEVDRTDPDGETILASVGGGTVPVLDTVGPLRDVPGVGRIPDDDYWWERSVVRLDPAGSWVYGMRIRTRGWERDGGSLAVDPGGGAFVTLDSRGPRVARLSRLLLGIDDVTPAAPGRISLGRISALPGGGFLLPELDTPYWRRPLLTRFRKYDTDLSLRATTRPGEVSLGFVPEGALVDARGRVVVFGSGDGVSFNAPGETPGPAGDFVARIPFGGHRPPSRLHARAEGTEGAVLLWPRDGDACVRFEVERIVPDAAPEVVGTAARDASGVRARGLRPGTRQQLRVVSVFPNGVRTAGPLREIVTGPAAPLGVAATTVGDQTVEVRWDDPNGDAVGHEIQARAGDGPWTAIGVRTLYRRPPEPSRWAGENPYLDRVPDVETPLRWRVRSTYRTLRSPWVESPPLLLAPSFRMTLSEGTLRTRYDGETEFSVEGTISPATPGTPLDFVPATEDLRLLFGRAEAPDTFVVPAGDLGWRTGTDGVHRWSAQRTLTSWHPDSEFALDPATGRFSLRFVGVESPVTPRVAVGVQFAAWRGGDLRAWTGSVREPFSLRLAPLGDEAGSR